ncbi:uncharacterized protein HaLaN_29723, partial [Haematococcus lacustris]
MEPEGEVDDAQEGTEQHSLTDGDNHDPEGIDGGPIFVTRSRTLKEQVRKAFRRMQLAVLQPWDMLAVEAAAEGVYHSMQQVPTAAFPLFLTSREYLNMLDGTLAEPFLPRHEDGSVVQPKEIDEGDGEDTLVELEVQHAAGTSTAEPTQGISTAAAGQAPVPWPSAVPRKGRKELTYQHLVDHMWNKITGKPND